MNVNNADRIASRMAVLQTVEFVEPPSPPFRCAKQSSISEDVTYKPEHGDVSRTRAGQDSSRAQHGGKPTFLDGHAASPRLRGFVDVKAPYDGTPARPRLERAGVGGQRRV